MGAHTNCHSDLGAHEHILHTRSSPTVLRKVCATSRFTSYCALCRSVVINNVAANTTTACQQTARKTGMLCECGAACTHTHTATHTDTHQHTCKHRHRDGHTHVCKHAPWAEPMPRYQARLKRVPSTTQKMRSCITRHGCQYPKAWQNFCLVSKVTLQSGTLQE